MRKVKIVVAPKLLHPWLKGKNFWAIFMPWGTAYSLPEYKDDPVMLAHEQCHMEQVERDGAFWFSVKYLWWTWRLGYKDNPYEVEAYKRASY